MYIKIHRSSLQIGGNIIEVGTHEAAIILDCGKNLPPIDGSETDDDIDIDGLMSGARKYNAVFISHYHNDHCGHINRVLVDIPVYTGVITKNVLTVIADFTNSDIRQDIRTFDDCRPINIGDSDISVTPIQVSHSAADAYMFLIRAEGKAVLYTGDYKQTELIIQKIRALLQDNERIDVLLTEGTNISPERSKNYIRNEDELSAKCVEIMNNTGGDVFVLGSSTNIDRINAVMEACNPSGRTFAEDLFTACVMDAAGQDGAFSNKEIKGFIWFGVDKDKNPRIHKHLDNNIRNLCSYKKLADIQKLCVYIRPTMLSFLENLNKLKSLVGSTLIYSFWSGYKNKADVAKLLDFCKNTSMNIVTLHVSGHASKQEIANLIMELNPVTVVPVHCEDRDAFNVITASCAFLDDNEAMELGS